MKSLLVKAAGGVILSGTISAIWLLPVSGKNGSDESQPVRPLRSEVVSTAIKIPRLSYPGIVRANDSVDLAFEVSGRLVNFPAGSGQKVKKGDVLAVLDTRDFMQDLNKAKAAAEQARLTEQRNITAAKKRIEGMMDKVVEGFETQLDKLFADSAMDISSDVAVLEQMLEKDGLSSQSSEGLTLKG